MNRKTHDAELCERIRVLEERVRELEARPAWYGGWWTPTPWVYPYWTFNTSGSVSTGSTITLPDGTQTTYTVGDIS